MLNQIQIVIGPFTFAIRTDHQSVIDNIKKIYQHYPTPLSTSFVDFDITITTQSWLRKILKPQVDFLIDEFAPFKPLPKDHAFAMLEWGMNWCIATKAHQFMILHAGTIEKNNKVIIMPAEQGSGKSTLTAAMVYNGWRLFSDELALISLNDKRVYPCTRPINLKNQSIQVIKDYLDHPTFSSTAHDTHKGTVALLMPPKESVERMHEPAKLHCFVFPKYVANSKASLKPIDKISAFELLIEQSFNYHILGEQGFNLLAEQLQTVECYEFQYSDFADAKRILGNLVE